MEASCALSPLASTLVPVSSPLVIHLRCVKPSCGYPCACVKPSCDTLMLCVKPSCKYPYVVSSPLASTLVPVSSPLVIHLCNVSYVVSCPALLFDVVPP
eukprot:1161696-Pelagomonas_calceolata.AAC.46